MKAALSTLSVYFGILCMMILALDWAEYRDTGACDECDLLHIVRPDLMPEEVEGGRYMTLEDFIGREK